MFVVVSARKRSCPCVGPLENDVKGEESCSHAHQVTCITIEILNTRTIGTAVNERFFPATCERDRLHGPSLKAVALARALN